MTVDGERIRCLGSALTSGVIPDGKYLVSHFGYSGDTPYNIAYSPMTDSISVVDHHQGPSVTISRRDVVKIVMAGKVEGVVEVERQKIETENILVGNIKNPQNIVFAHFDSIIGRGAIDNAGSVVTMMGCLTSGKNLLDKSLFIFSGNEEMSYDSYQASGYGFRVFENEYAALLKGAKRIIVMDGVGIGVPSFTQHGLEWVLQLRMLEQIRAKVFWLQNDQSSVLQYFHTVADTESIIKKQYLLAAEELIVQACS